MKKRLGISLEDMMRVVVAILAAPSLFQIATAYFEGKPLPAFHLGVLYAVAFVLAGRALVWMTQNPNTKSDPHVEH